MFCKVCSREINAATFETIGNQIVCSLACVGLLQSNDEDKCNECQRPVWKDNYYKIDSLFYCSERCKKKVVKNHLKKFNTIQNINIMHIENEFFKNDSPMKNLKELRKEVKEFYKDFDMDETAIIKSIPISCKSTFNYKDKIIDNDKESINNISSINNQKNNNKILSLKKYIKKYPAIPNRLSKNSLSREKRNNSRKKTIENFLKRRKNYSFDNHDKYFYNTNDKDADIVCHLKYINKRRNNNNSFFNDNKKSDKRAKLKQTFLKLKNNNIPIIKTKNAKYQIPNPLLYQYNLNEGKKSKYNNYRYYERRFENKENNNSINIPFSTENYFKNIDLNNKENKEMTQNFVERNEIYRYDENINI